MKKLVAADLRELIDADKLKAANEAAEILVELYKRAGMDHRIVLYAIHNLYHDVVGVRLPIPLRSQEDGTYRTATYNENIHGE